MLVQAPADIHFGMNRGLYTAASGMYSSQVWLDTVANNLANASTTGYKRDEVAFEESLLRELRNDGGRGQIIGDIQSGPQVVKVSTSFDHGSLQATGGGLDVAILGNEGMFAVQTGSGVKYTRAGSFTLNSQREIVDPNGNPVLDAQRRPIRADRPGAVQIGPDGTVSVGDQALGKVAVFEGEFKKSGLNLYDANGTPTENANASLATGTVEASNVNVVATMIQMVQVQRLFEMAQKSIQSHDETTGQLVKSANPQ